MAHERTLIGQSAVSLPAGHDNAADPSPRLEDYYQWVEPDRGIRIYINFETAERLQVHILQGLDSKGGVEVGGILLGRTKVEEGGIKAVIEDFEPVPITYSQGPLYSANAARFEAALKKHGPGTDSGLPIAGYYRSHKRDDLYLSADDLAFIRRVFPGSENVFLLVKPLSIRACTGGFFFWDDGNIQSEFTLEVPFAPIRRPSSAPDAIDDLLLPDRLDLTLDLTTVPQEAVSSRDYRWRGRTRDLVAAATGIILSLGVFGYWQMRRTAGPDPAPAVRVAQVTQKIGGVQPKDLERPSSIPATPLRPPVQQKFPIPSSSKQPPPAAYVPKEALVPPPPDPKLEEAPSLPGQTLPGKLNLNDLPVTSTVAAPPEVVAPPKPAVLPGVTPAVTSVEPGTSRLPSKTSFVGPQITYRVNPPIPLDVRALINGEAQIDVTVAIDAAGRVTGAQVTSTKGAAARLVTAEAIKAARLCRFQPARENGQAVQSRMVLTFRFKRAGE